jgi:hypothetical protein
MKVSELQDKAGLTLMNEIYDKDIDGVFISDMVSDIVAGAQPNNLLITIQTHKNLIATANLVDISAVVFVRGKKPAEDTVELTAPKSRFSQPMTMRGSWRLNCMIWVLNSPDR